MNTIIKTYEAMADRTKNNAAAIKMLCKAQFHCAAHEPDFLENFKRLQKKIIARLESLENG